MKILYGTHNKAKLNAMRECLEEILNIELVGLQDLHLPIPNIEESGSNPLENAIIKAKQFYNEFKMPVFSCDSGLYFEGVEDDLQPGTYVRRVNGKELSDEEMITYYSNLASKYENGLIARYQNAICLIMDDNHSYTSMDDTLSAGSFRIISKPHGKKVEGFPLDSISVDLKTNTYFFDLKDKTIDKSLINEGFRNFFINALKENGEKND
ncbi:non-canonical purine NTP pyrophosphatase [Anaerorhabdus sp.]|uniref:non-canonical purine NTP pyrophosphatase n=1 Tax=Anaerorhabdus sp. TaxID=1872524 RepID=UPI002B1EF5DF|nr:non-canonical purine NTP pyrophosphatase [Anaerorhabdus sp.]MEA4875213.1 non-canonical purine NTP pyrophosphatase [Anaerorhabdus sp.]